MSVIKVSLRNLVLASGLTALVLAGGVTTKLNAQSEITFEAKSSELRFANCSLKGTYAFGFIGLAPQVVDPDSVSQYNPFATGGIWHFHGDGTFDASDTQVASGISTDRKYSGTYSINPNGTGTADFTAGLTHHRNLVIVDHGKRIEFIQTDGLVVGTMIKQ